MATADQIINRAANALGILRLSGQNLQNQDKVRIASAYEEVYDALKAGGHAKWAYAGEVPAKLVAPLVALIAQNCVESGYGVSAERYQRIQFAAGPGGETARSMIKQLSANKYASQTEPTDF